MITEKGASEDLVRAEDGNNELKINTHEQQSLLGKEKADACPSMSCSGRYTLFIVLFAFVVLISALCVAAVVVIVVYVLIAKLDIRVLQRIEFPANTTIPHGQFRTTLDGYAVLSLNGTNYEMGYANGFILGEVISKSVDFMVMFFRYNSRKYEKAVEEIYKKFDHKQFYFDELQGVVQGAKDNGGASRMHVKVLNREWNIKDLVMLNALYDWHIPYIKDHIFGCSAVGISGGFAYDGQPYFGRLLDFTFDPKGFDVQALILTVYNNKILSFAYPGQVGIITGFNNHGVWVSCNDPDNGRNAYGEYPPQFSTSNFVNRKFLETVESSSEQIHSVAKSHYSQFHYMYSFLQFIGNRNHSFVLEQNLQKVATRGEFDKYVILTNHMRVLEPPQPCDRYARYKRYFDTVEKVTWDGLYFAQVENQQKVPRRSATLLCVQFYPNSLEFRLGTATLNGEEGKWWTVGHYACEDPIFKSTVYRMEDFYFQV